MDAASPAGAPAVQQGNLAALEDDDAGDASTRHTLRLGVALGIIALAALAVASLVWPNGG